MLNRYEDLNEESLSEIRFANPTHALSLLKALPGNAITDSAFNTLFPTLMYVLAANPDPDRALANLALWLEQVGSRTIYFDLLTRHPAALDALLTVFACSQFLADIVIRNPEYFEVLANPRVRDRVRTMEDFLADAKRRVGVASTPGKQRDALRRFKLPEVLRIGARDILGYAALEQTIAEISDFAEACVRIALEICGAGDGFAVIGMGKLGGRELNYASDIDLIFIHSDTLSQTRANQIGEAVRETLAKPTEAGFLFRVDLRLRPEGRFGAISRSLAACRAYYESWAEPWERQALLKARFVGGDPVVGAEFISLAEQFVYRKQVTEEFVESIRENKRLLEAQTARASEAYSNVKQGIGGIRDVEFAVQLLQLMAGGRHPELRVGATLPALNALVQVGLISAEECAILGESYRFLRNVEHRLQIMDERPVRTLPLNNTEDLNRFGRRLGYLDGSTFLAEYRRHTERVSKLFCAIFYGEETISSAVDGQEWDLVIIELVRSPNDPAAIERLIARLTELGFSDPVAAAEMLRTSEIGSDYGEIMPDARERFALLAPRIIFGSAATSHPDTALKGFEQLSLASPSRAALYAALLGAPGLLERLLVLASDAPSLWQAVVGHLEYLDLLGDESQLDAPTPIPATADAVEVARYIRRERLRIAVRDLWGLADTAATVADTTAMMQSVLVAALKQPAFADIAAYVSVIGMGKLGGAELGYGSDLDVLWVVDEGEPAQAQSIPSLSMREGQDTQGMDEANRRVQRAGDFATRVMAFLTKDIAPYVAALEIDARLRPDGRVGVLARSVAGYAQYFSTSAQTWEKQALIKARHIAGNAAVGAKFVRMAREIVYGAPLTNEQADELRHMKHRIETERCKDVQDIKLGRGGLSDIEWTTQLLQWRHAKRWPKAQVSGTLPALLALRDAAVIRQDDWETLSDTYLALTHLRNRQWLAGIHSLDVSLHGRNDLTEARAQVRMVFERLFLV